MKNNDRVTDGSTNTGSLVGNPSPDGSCTVRWANGATSVTHVDLLTLLPVPDDLPHKILLRIDFLSHLFEYLARAARATSEVHLEAICADIALLVNGREDIAELSEIFKALANTQTDCGYETAYNRLTGKRT